MIVNGGCGILKVPDCQSKIYVTLNFCIVTIMYLQSFPTQLLLTYHIWKKIASSNVERNSGRVENLSLKNHQKNNWAKGRKTIKDLGGSKKWFINSEKAAILRKNGVLQNNFSAAQPRKIWWRVNLSRKYLIAKKVTIGNKTQKQKVTEETFKISNWLMAHK